jgi:hypothetical protein
MKKSSILMLAAIGGTLMTPQAASGQSCTDVQELKDAARQMQRTIDSLNSRIAELESKQATTAKASKRKTKIEVPAPIGEAPSGRQSPVENRRAFNDQQEAVSRPLDYTLDPKYAGFLPIPNSGVMMKFNLRPRVDVTTDNFNSGSPSRFIPAKFAVEGAKNFSDATRSNLSANGSQLRIDVRNPGMDGNFRVYYQNDFFGDEQKMDLRVQHFYAQYFGFKAGFTTSAWENGDVWPDTVDYEGPNALVFARRPTLQYTRSINDAFSATVGLDRSGIAVDGADPITQTPDIAANLRWEDSTWGHVQVSAIGRRIGAKDPTGDEDYVNGWGLNLGSNINLTENDFLQFLGVYGEGVGGLGNDSGFFDSDAGYSSSGNLEALPYWSLMAGYTHQWSGLFASTVTYGYANLDNSSGQANNFYQNSTYASANLIWKIKARWTLGLEVLYGLKEVKNGDTSGDNYRVQLGMNYALFD